MTQCLVLSSDFHCRENDKTTEAALLVTVRLLRCLEKFYSVVSCIIISNFQLTPVDRASDGQTAGVFQQVLQHGLLYYYYY